MKISDFPPDTVRSAEEAREITANLLDLVSGKAFNVGTFAIGAALAEILVGCDMADLEREQFMRVAFPEMVLAMAKITQEEVHNDSEEETPDDEPRH